MGKSILSICMASGFILFAQSAMAGTQVYFTFGIPIVQFEMDGGCPYEDDVCGDDPYNDDIWIEGHYCTGHPNHVWVPGYWVPAWHNHAVCIQRQPVYHRFHCNPAQDSYRHTPRQSYGHYSVQGRHGFRDTRREGYNRQQDNHQPRNNNQGRSNYSDKGQGNSSNQQNSPQGQYSPQRHDGYRSGGNWMNNINNKVIKRQINQTRQD
jgi:hypothetical protein